jgi:predicted nucleotidyltransferase
VTRVSSRSLQHEMARLESLGLVQRERDGRMVRYRAVAGHPRWAVLREMVCQFVAPAELLRVALSEVPGLEAAFIYGSFARGDMRADSDIDVFALGVTVDEEDTEYALAEGALGAAGLLGREVNITSYTLAQFTSRRARRTPFLTSVIGGPKKWLVGDESSLEEAGGGVV